MKDYVGKEEVQELMDRFEELAEAKLASRVDRYGKLEGDDGDYAGVVEHLFDEFAEFIAAYAKSLPELIEIITFIIKESQYIFEHEKERDIKSFIGRLD